MRCSFGAVESAIAQRSAGKENSVSILFRSVLRPGAVLRPVRLRNALPPAVCRCLVRLCTCAVTNVMWCIVSDGLCDSPAPLCHTHAPQSEIDDDKI